MTKEEILSIEKCDCGRPWCDYFDSLESHSMTEKEVKELLREYEEDTEEIIKHLKNILKK